jgi:hypothetical protein
LPLPGIELRSSSVDRHYTDWATAAPVTSRWLRHYTDVPLDSDLHNFCCLAKYRKYVKRRKAAANHVFQSKAFEFFTWDEPLRRYTLYIINVKSYRDVATLT